MPTSPVSVVLIANGRPENCHRVVAAYILGYFLSFLCQVSYFAGVFLIRKLKKKVQMFAIKWYNLHCSHTNYNLAFF